jgi:nitrogen fixation/metabolism regulation signal transduction histidine kinase
MLILFHTNTRVANGDLNARIPLTKDNALWQVSSSLNNILSRLQRSRQELQQTRAELEDAHEEIRKLKSRPTQ